MRIEEYGEKLLITKEIEVHPYFPQNDSDINPETGDSISEVWSIITNNISRKVNTQLLRGILAATLQEDIPTYMIFRSHPVLDIIFSEPVFITPLTNIERDVDKDYTDGLVHNMVVPTIMFNVYDMFSGLPTISIPIHIVATFCEDCYKDEDECALRFINYWINKVIESYGGKEKLKVAIFADDFSNQPLEDVYVIATGQFIDNQLPIKAYGGDIEKARVQAPSDLAGLHLEYEQIKKQLLNNWEKYSKTSKKDDEARILEYKQSRKRILGK